ncbi:ArgR family transcriptional regulator [Haematospirillum jordaniae]|uniref:Arginine repressor n=1 Tax=Haematospirillum jordaniae TaxID=1549855 RepID=A0A143DFY9_9PROT|nr:ArgR family transcriptional regulator [Haematospirillum jordaniae]AMW35694.1 ArgR family transcriptional regulator [Haematospirillum jordaniae]NKD45564.1 ArgR family transcriptional regulator [Haematospirillum jordaniae]NKD56140.1 ArgR family transcriptional regulator [Haematospirillum jordaniae]NKD58198.1 ArgR family transcriptional regulator [Haematospirillum jordaniae]NKD66631.1 ArgR family transcriptional regulator [Haematospirillum jordaniae]
MTHEPALDGHILNIIQSHAIYEQSEIQEILERRGYKIPQATLSRRLKKLNIAKVSGQYKSLEVFQGTLPVIKGIQVSALGLIILHTHPGQANSIAYALDQKYVQSSSQKDSDHAGILGTIAGDDTILIIIESKSALEVALDHLCADFPYLDRPTIPQT